MLSSIVNPGNHGNVTRFPSAAFASSLPGNPYCPKLPWLGVTVQPTPAQKVVSVGWQLLLSVLEKVELPAATELRVKVEEPSALVMGVVMVTSELAGKFDNSPEDKVDGLELPLYVVLTGPTVVPPALTENVIVPASLKFML